MSLDQKISTLENFRVTLNKQAQQASGARKAYLIGYITTVSKQIARLYSIKNEAYL